MIKLDPENVEAYKEAAKFAKHVTKDKTLAMEYLQASVKLNPSDPDALSELAAIMSERGLPEQAQQLLEGALELDPSHAQSICEYGRLCEGSFNDLEAAYGMYIQALESNPRHLDSLVRLAGLVLSRDAEQHFEERFEFIEKLLLRAFEIDEKEPRALANYATLLHEKVLRTREDDDADHAETMYMRAIMADPSRVQALSGFGDFEMTVRRDTDRAELLFRTALEYDMEHCATLCHYAVLLGATGSKNAAAEDMFRRAIQSNPSNVDVLGEHANFLYRGKKDELAAEAQYRHALSLNPQHIATLNNFATMLLERAEPGEECSEAEQLLFTALRLEPSDVDTILNCASLLWEIKRDQEASRQMCLRALKAQPDHVGALCQYAVLQLKMNGDAEAAMNTIERARLIDPTNEFVISGQEWFRAQVMQQRADKAAAIREKACEEERMYRERLADAEAGQGVAGESKEGVDGGVEGRVEGAQDCRSPGVPGGGQNVGGASRGPAAVKREVEGPKQGPRYESLGMERLPDDIPDGTVMSDASVGCLVGNSAVAKTAGGYPGGGMPIGDEEVEEIFRGAVAAAQQGGIYTGGRMNAGDPSLAQ
jgi:Tfp pilus assembly protein PilF